MYDLGPDNVTLCNGSSDTIDAMMRVFLQPGDEIIMSNPTFGLFPVRAELCGAKVVQIPLREGDLQYVCRRHAQCRHRADQTAFDYQPQ